MRTNIQGELENAQVSVHLNASVDLNLVKKRPSDQYLFINNRYIKDRLIRNIESM